MRRSIAIGAGVVCALGGTTAVATAGGDEFGGVRIEVTYSSGRSSETQRQVERAEARLRAAQRAYEDAKCKLDEFLARQSAAAGELTGIERKLADFRPRNEYELRRLHEELDRAQRDAAAAEAVLSHLRNLAASAQRAADAARDDYFRRAERSGAVIEARQRIDRSRSELDGARQFALDRLHASFDWRQAHSWRDEVAARLADAERGRAPRYEVDRLKRDLAEADSRLGAMQSEALACDPRVRDAEARLASDQRAHDELWACVQRDLDGDAAYGRATDDARRFEQEAARADQALCDARDLIARLGREIDHLRGSHYIVDTRDLEHRAASLRVTLDCLVRDARAASDYLRRADRELQDARCAYDAALAAHRRCLEEERNVYHERPRHDPRGGDDARHRIDPRQRDDARRHNDDDDDDDDRDDRRESRDDDRARQNERDRDRAAGANNSQGTYRDRGERYERAKAQDAGRKRTRD